MSRKRKILKDKRKNVYFKDKSWHIKGKVLSRWKSVIRIKERNKDEEIAIYY